LFGCLVVWLFGCLVVWLFGCLVVWFVWLCNDDIAFLSIHARLMNAPFKSMISPAYGPEHILFDHWL
jgi:hypothetical protein